MRSGGNNITVLLPMGLEPDQYHDLAQALVNHAAPQIRAEGTVSVPGRGYLALSELTQAPPGDMPVLNDSTWTLSMSLPDDADLEALAAAVKSLPGGADIAFEPAAEYRASNPET